VLWSGSLDSASIQFLHSKEALTLPNTALLRSLLQSYVDWAHPQIPFLDLAEFLGAIAEDTESHQVSLLLLHAVLLVGSLYLAEHAFCKSGFLSRRHAQECLFERAKVRWVTVE